eukprot:GDKI01038791.1.p1 GENE.GDKI01038791.1~~GDKI01038791.1.p1  ORF type:complete len:110 (+),score=39.67 GDKI01038791.1:50-379(+)
MKSDNQNNIVFEMPVNTATTPTHAHSTTHTHTIIFKQTDTHAHGASQPHTNTQTVPRKTNAHQRARAGVELKKYTSQCCNNRNNTHMCAHIRMVCARTHTQLTQERKKH